MKYLLLLFLTIYSINAKAQTPSVKKLVDLVKTHNIDSVTAYADKLGYVKGIEMPQIGNMYEFAITSFAKKDTGVVKSSISYSSGRHYEMNQGPLMVSLSYYTSSKTEFDTLVDEIKTLGVTETLYKDGDPYYHLYNYADVKISTYINSTSNTEKYSISFNFNYW
jgi:hypothetical protein